MQLYRGTIEPYHIKSCSLIAMRFFYNIPKKTTIVPALKAHINSMPTTKAWWQISPRYTRAQNIQNTTERIIVTRLWRPAGQSDSYKMILEEEYVDQTQIL